MKINAHCALSTRKVLLVPYSPHHVPTYHEWMQDPDLQAATASEPLTLEEEYAMQWSWRTDNDKLTFIVCLPLDVANKGQSADVRVGLDDSPEHMIGDINLFLFPSEDEDGDDAGTSNGDDHQDSVVGEIELMIARKDLQRQGYGRAALLTFMGYIIFHWATIYVEYNSQHASRRESDKEPSYESIPQLAYFRVKIQAGNVGSIKLFESVGFKRTAEGANYFGEVELRWREDGPRFLRELKELPMFRGEDGWEAGSLPYYKTPTA